MHSRLTILLPFLLLLVAAERERPLDRLFVPATAKAAPVEKRETSDLPLNRKGVDEQTAKYLDAFDVSAGKFEYTLQLVSEEETFRLYRLVYPSPMETPSPANHVVPAALYFPRGARPQAKVPCAVLPVLMCAPPH